MQKQRLLGIELCRGLSTYAVILVHSGDETWGLPIDTSAIVFRQYFYFAVPFFLATAFYFMSSRRNSNPRAFWHSRVARILVPYIVWSGLFLASRITVFKLANKPDRLQELLQDPLAIVFFGGASYQLYFLPLLLAGTTLVLLIPLLDILRLGQAGLLFLSGLAIGLYHYLEASGNAFQLGQNVAFQSLMNLWSIDLNQHPWLRLILVEAAWMIKCLPYFLVALSLRQVLKNPAVFFNKAAVFGGASAFLLVAVWGKLLLPAALQEILLAYILLLLGISLSGYLKTGISARFAVSIGACSFGIYLIHPFAINVVRPLTGKLLPEITAAISIPSMLVISLGSFLLSWIAVVYLTRHKVAAKYLFGM